MNYYLFMPDADQKIVQLEQAFVELEGNMKRALAGIDDKCRRAFEENGQVVSGLRGDIQGLLRMMTSGQAGPYQASSGLAVAPPPVPFASQAPSVEAPTLAPVPPAGDGISPIQLKVTSSVCAVMEGVAQDRRGVVKELGNLVKCCTFTGIFDSSFTSEVIVTAGRSGNIMFIQFVGQEARDEFVRRFQLKHRGQDEHFGKIKAPDAEEIKAANARSGAAFDRALNAARRQSKRPRDA